MAGNYAVKVPTCDGLRIPAHRPRIRISGLIIINLTNMKGRTLHPSPVPPSDYDGSLRRGLP